MGPNQSSWTLSAHVHAVKNKFAGNCATDSLRISQECQWSQRSS